MILSAHQTEMIDITVTVTNINTMSGNIHVGLFNTSKHFLIEGKEYQTASKKVEDDSIVIVLNDIPKGNYAISLYHDINADKECNLNFFGAPVEPFGFSNNYRPIISKPSFDDCKINANRDLEVWIKLID